MRKKKDRAVSIGSTSCIKRNCPYYSINLSALWRKMIYCYHYFVSFFFWKIWKTWKKNCMASVQFIFRKNVRSYWKECIKNLYLNAFFYINNKCKYGWFTIIETKNGYTSCFIPHKNGNCYKMYILTGF